MLFATYLKPDNGTDRDISFSKSYLIPNKTYEVETVDMGQSYTFITLKGLKGCFNSVQFEFSDKWGNLVDIYSDPRYNPYI